MTLCIEYFPDAYGTKDLEGAVTAAVMGPIAAVATILRLLGRWIVMSGKLGADDWFIIASTVWKCRIISQYKVYANVSTGLCNCNISTRSTM